MALIMCTQKLLKALGKQGRPPGKAVEPQLLGVRLGSWAATVCRFDRRDLVIALDQRTYLTLVFPLAPRSGFRAPFADALAALLAGLDPCVPLEAVAQVFANPRPAPSRLLH
jgi:hypothetical protein